MCGEKVAEKCVCARMTLNVITFMECVHALWAGWEHTATCVSSKTVTLRYLDAKYHIYLCVVYLLGGHN